MCKCNYYSYLSRCRYEWHLAIESSWVVELFAWLAVEWCEALVELVDHLMVVLQTGSCTGLAWLPGYEANGNKNIVVFAPHHWLIDGHGAVSGNKSSSCEWLFSSILPVVSWTDDRQQVHCSNRMICHSLTGGETQTSPPLMNVSITCCYCLFSSSDPTLLMA